MYDPIQLALMSMAAAKNPQFGADLLARSGVAPPGVEGGTLPQFVSPAMQGQIASGELGSLLAGGGEVPTPMSPEQTAGLKDGTGAAPNPLAALQGFKAPQVDNKPIMNAGVSGAQKSPELTLGALKGGSSAIQALMGLTPQTRIPGLAELLKGLG